VKGREKLGDPSADGTAYTTMWLRPPQDREQCRATVLVQAQYRNIRFHKRRGILRQAERFIVFLGKSASWSW